MENLIGMVKSSLTDIPGVICSTVFFSGCNLKCKYCQNKEWLDNPRKEVSENDIFENLNRNFMDRKMISGICFTGGEVTCSDYEKFCKIVKKIREKYKGIIIKIDTNGTNPDFIKKLFNDGVLDCVSVDIKTNIENLYGEFKMDKVYDTLSFLVHHKIKTEIRLTMFPEYFDLKSKELTEFVKKIKYQGRISIQQYRITESCRIEPFKIKKLVKFSSELSSSLLESGMVCDVVNKF